MIYRLRKKYGNTVEEMLDYLSRCRKELEEIQDSSAAIERLQKKLDAAIKGCQREK